MLHFSHESPLQEEILNKTPTKANIQVAAIFDAKNNSLTTSELALVADNNLFSPARGVDPASLQASTTSGRRIKHNQLELTGIWKMGTLKGAIILNTTASRSSKNSNKKKF